MSAESIAACDHVAGYCCGKPVTPNLISPRHMAKGWYKCALEDCIIDGEHYHQKPEFDSSKEKLTLA